MANSENLKPFKSDQDREAAARNGRKGGLACAAKKRERKTMREMLKFLLEQEIQNKQGKKATTLEAIMTAAIAKAIKGDIKATQFIRDTIGEMPTQVVNNNNTNANINIDDATVINEVLNKLKDL